MEINKISNIKISLGQSISDNNKKEQFEVSTKIESSDIKKMFLKKTLKQIQLKIPYCIAK